VIVVDTSALIAIARNEANSNQVIAAFSGHDQVLISAGTLAEVYIVAMQRNVSSQTAALMNGLDLEVIPVTKAVAQRIGTIYAKWGRGAGTAGLNFGDCFAYELAQRNDCKLLYVGEDFSKTDVVSAI
jgi:ribonuclease VapC